MTKRRRNRKSNLFNEFLSDWCKVLQKEIPVSFYFQMKKGSITARQLFQA